MVDIAELLLRILLAYLLGSVMGAVIIGRLRGVDLYACGSRNPGATNAFRVLGKKWGALVLLVDAGKGLLAVLLIANLPIGSGAGLWQGWQAVFCGGAALLGHALPLYHGFRGGKGVATGAGIVLGLAPLAVALLLPVYALTLVLSGYASLASLLAAAMLPVTVLLTISPPQLMPRLLLSIGIALFVLYRHRDNIRRLRDREEPRLERAMLLKQRSLKYRPLKGWPLMPRFSKRWPPKNWRER